MKDRFGLAGRTVVVAGAGGGGIGTAICVLLGEAGATVVGMDNRPEALDAPRKVLEATGAPHRLVVADVRRPAQVDDVVAAADEDGALHGLVHVAGGMWPTQWAPLLDLDLETFDEVTELNARSALITMRAAARRLVAAGRPGSVVAVSSVAGLTAMPYGVGYAAGKAAMLALTRTAALEWGGHGIRVNSVAPGTVQTPKTRAVATDGVGAPGPEAPLSDAPRNDAERAALPLGRRGRPEDIAGAVVFCLSDLASWMTGQVLVVDGGSSAKPSFLDGDNVPVFVTNPALRERLRAPSRYAAPAAEKDARGESS